MNTQELGVNQVAQRIHLRLRRYLEAQYHIRDAGLIEERRLLLEEPGGISQRPFVEVTPSYAVLDGFSGVATAPLVMDLLQELSGWRSPSIGVYPPYRHQAEALERFFPAPGGAGEDLVVATGTGSGKTETFLYSILGALALEGSERRASFARRGVRALLLYPMNALVSDQTSRLRRLLGDPRLAALFRDRYGRQPQFGMYTSRTPYPGVRKGAKDRRHLDRLLRHYVDLETSSAPDDQTLVQDLKSRGRWPAKDLVRFYAEELAEKVLVKSGKNGGKEKTLGHWERRFLTGPDDRELLTRHEMQLTAPDLLITNYSMLEYMLLRPIERSLFSQTREWLAADSRNQLLLILDEAHMYRGVGGAEVGLLIRRLMSRLGIARDRLRCILTSASLGADGDTEAAGKAFATALTGKATQRTFAVVRGTREVRRGARPGTAHEVRALAAVSAPHLAAVRISSAEAQATIDAVSAALSWPTPPRLEEGDLAARQHVTRCLNGFGPLEALLERCSGNGTAFNELAEALFPAAPAEVAQQATDGLLALGTFARRTEPGREEQPLLPTRVHLLFRGLPPLYACVNPACSARREAGRPAGLVGKLFTAPQTQCACGARVYELLTHRDCGAAFLRVFGAGPNADFFWHERGGKLTEFGKPLHELHLFLEEPHPTQTGEVAPVILDVMTGRALSTASASAAGTRLCYRATSPVSPRQDASSFGVCPACTRRTQTGNSFKIMDLATKGEQPFANLVREQFVTQLPVKPASDVHPNEGRKALLFSDGRQKAARLARDLPREVERDSFREALALAVQARLAVSSEPAAVLDERLYAAFVSVCARFHLHFFDREDQRTLLEDIAAFRKDYGGDLELAIGDEWKPTPPTRYRQALLRQVGDPYYSLTAACAGVVEVRPNKLRHVQQRAGAAAPPEVVADIASCWLRDMLAHSAFDPALTLDAREDEFPYFQPVRAGDGQKQLFLDAAARACLDATSMGTIRAALFDVLTRDGVGGDAGRLVTCDSVALRLALDATWLQCAACGNVQLTPVLGGCANLSCGGKQLEPRPPDHPYMVARKDFFRQPLRAVLGGDRPVHITAEEHTAQLSQRDAGEVYATTEEFELRFQDVPLGPELPPVDILSCTTTMEVGIDIGSLTAVGLRTVPPQRENYQQRAGRAGRRGTSVSSVLTFAQGGAHDAHYFANPHAIISGPPRAPRIKSDNRRLARRHIHAHLLQTFFHGQIDLLPPAQQQALAEGRSNIMSAFGDAEEFFTDAGPFSFESWKRWLAQDVLSPGARLVEEIAAWLPEELAPGPGSLAERRRLVVGVAEALRESLEAVGREVRANAKPADPQAQVGAGGAHDDDAGSLLDLLFDRGLLPSYAFPTDLCSFVIQEWAEHGQVGVAERPQLGKAQALSEYAPGRLLVVNKRTYRVGGIFVDIAPTASPGADLFLRALRRYVGCPCCGFVRLEEGTTATQTIEGSGCPVCASPLFVREFIDPPAFSPEAGRALAEGDREQELTYASSAQMPELAERPEFTWREGPGVNLKRAYGEDVLLVVANKGNDSKGFSVCESCGGAWLDGDEPAGPHARPFLLPNHVRAREGAHGKCGGNIRRSLFLAHEFRTDVLLLRIPFRAPLDFTPEQPWLFDALSTLSEALALGASLHLNIDAGELSSGFRLLPGLDGEAGLAEIYLFDTSSGGAGYAADAGAELDDVLSRTEALLAGCPGPGGCERSCTKCLRHYGNRFLHDRLDRRLGLALVEYIRRGAAPVVKSVADQVTTLVPLRRLLEMEGWAANSDPAAGRPLVATSPAGRRVVVGTFPCLLNPDLVAAGHPTRAAEAEVLELMPDYVVERDLPSAYQIVLGIKPARTRRAARAAPGGAAGSVINLAVRELRRIAAAGASLGTVQLTVTTPPAGDAFAARVPSAALSPAGFAAGEWLVLTTSAAASVLPDQWVVAQRARGSFAATGEAWTIARVKFLDEAKTKLQLSYGKAQGKEFRPERCEAAEVQLVATVLCHAAEGD